MKKLRKDQKGFTLVELIVILVILAILAAMLVPALLGYIDKARNGKYLEEAHSIYTAIQVVEDEQYAKGAAAITSLTGTSLTEVNNMVDPTAVQTAAITCAATTTTTTDHKEYTVSQLTLKFKSQDGNIIDITMGADGTWGTPTITAATP
ncbi:MAG: type II secretion system GspH family protein [Lachnospiraceae bacterium]|nr:type II secretion system GspH family protein [Lachnospiraceae bacterium]